MSWISEKFWTWPNGLVWRITRKPTIASRQKKFETFLQAFEPTSTTTILDVGVSGVASGERGENFLEEWYQYPEKITAVGVDDLTPFKKRYPKVKVVQADGKKLPFKDKQFEIVFSNAVIEHVGEAEAQRQFVAECLRVGKRVFLTTPARSFPLESHTMILFVHWLPMSLRNKIYRSLGRAHEGQKGNLTLLTANAFRRLFPKKAKVKILKQRLLGLTSSLIAIV